MVRLRYRDPGYFEQGTYYLFLDIALKRLLVSKVGFHSGSWWTDHGLRFKCTSVPCCTFKEIEGRKILYKGCSGRISKPLGQKNCLGTQWDKGLQYYWNDVNLLLRYKGDSGFFLTFDK